MNNNQIVSKPESNPKRKAVISLVLGVISTMPILWLILGAIVIYMVGQEYLEVSDVILYAALFSIPAGIIAIPGLIFGIIGLRSTKKVGHNRHNIVYDWPTSISIFIFFGIRLIPELSTSERNIYKIIIKKSSFYEDLR